MTVSAMRTRLPGRVLLAAMVMAVAAAAVLFVNTGLILGTLSQATAWVSAAQTALPLALLASAIWLIYESLRFTRLKSSLPAAPKSS